MHVIVPVKSFARAKSRLAPILDNAQRAALAYALARDVLAELARVRGLKRVVVASSEPEVEELVRRHGYELLPDVPGASLNEVLTRALARMTRSVGEAVAVVCADLPLFNAEEFERMSAMHAAAQVPALTIAPDHLGQGTNVRISPTSEILPCLYGPGSAVAHMRAAAARGLAVQVFNSRSFGLDIDRPESLLAIARAVPEGLELDSSAALLASWAGALGGESYTCLTQ
ncbi:2-phospho-L-lactate guanylyltransferase [Alcaligenaceae bacterium]|nr:2-phospho-L-lactate guanylyltransferase [Alcaligenaceae bacterium]